MVKINAQQMITENGTMRPFMHAHPLRCIKSAPTFKEGELTNCYIAKYDHGRFAVMSMSGVDETQYHVFASEQELHEHFEESVLTNVELWIESF